MAEECRQESSGRDAVLAADILYGGMQAAVSGQENTNQPGKKSISKFEPRPAGKFMPWFKFSLANRRAALADSPPFLADETAQPRFKALLRRYATIF